MRILLTGSSGWLGRYLAPMLKYQGHGVVGFDVAVGEHTNVVASVADRNAVDGVFSEYGIDAIIHAGALHKPDIARHPPQAFIDANVTGTLNLLEAARRTAVQRFVFTSTTSLMISQAIRSEESTHAVWLDETSGPLEPRNIYGVTKLAAEGLCRDAYLAHGLPCIVLRTSRFFPEEDDTHRELTGENMKSNELLFRRLTVEDAARAHIDALYSAPNVGFDVLLVSAPTPFSRCDVNELRRGAPAVIRRYYPEAERLYALKGWTLPSSIGRVYDASRAENVIGFRASTDFGAVLAAIDQGFELPFAHDANYVPPHAMLPQER